ncbi:MAG: Cronobacter phage [Bacteroidota bacterium]|jgi:hypothetical protein
MSPSFSDLHCAVVNHFKNGIEIPFHAEEKPLKQEKKPKHKITKPKKEISVKEIKNLISSIKQSGCSVCGYNRCSSALEFHHRDRKEKSFALSKALIKKTRKEILDEIDKCILVCSNCHKEIHAGLIEIK